jgi:hypothetical protein
MFDKEVQMYYKKNFRFILIMVFILSGFLYPQVKNYNPYTMYLDVGNFSMSFKRVMGDGGLQSQYSWNLTGNNAPQTEIFYWPADRWQSNMLFQIFNPLSLDDNGIIDENGVQKPMMTRGDALTNFGVTDWAYEVRRYRPPHIVVDGILLDPPYQWNVDPNLESDIKIEFEDVLPQFGIRSHIEVFAFSNPEHGDYFIWKATHKFTGEIKRPRDAVSSLDSLPDQTIKFWWPIALSFGPSKAGEREVQGGFGFEGQDDLDSWFKVESEYVISGRDSLYIAYYWDYDVPSVPSYPNGSTNDVGDPDRTTGFLHSTQIPGYALLYADKSATDKTDDITQPYAMPHATIINDLWGRRDIGLKLTYRGDDNRGRFPADPITQGFYNVPQKGHMRFITVGPYELTKNIPQNRIDSITFVYAVGVGDIGFDAADSIGRKWLNGEISDSLKNQLIMQGRDSLANVMNRAYWIWDRMSKGLSVPAAPPPPDIEVTSGADFITVDWSYPTSNYFNDYVTGVDDWYAWRVYKKEGSLLVNDPLDQKSGSTWILVYETINRNQTTFIDSNVIRGHDYYYAVTALDDGTQNDGIFPGQKLESSRFVNRSQLFAVPYKPGFSTLTENQVRVVPNPATVAEKLEGREHKISFFNLPYKCTLNIFTETGDLVKTIEHLGTADEEWEQRTDHNQYVASGIYILAITNAQALDGTKLENQFVKFVIVR